MSDSTAELIQELQENQVATYTGLAVTSIILYDYIITLDQEISVLCGDVIVVVSTLVKTFQQWRESRRLKLKLSASSLLLRDGTVYFILLLALNVAQILTAETPATTLTASATQFITTMPSVLISRFILNLRQLSQTDSTESTADVDRFSRFSVPNFRVPSDLLGNIGEPLDHRQDEAVFLGDSRSESGFASERRVSDESGSSTDHSGRSESENGV
ncbi:uncharacterized protein PHACADRAFT_199151 [Phanerochaete carnosa HHB-10118-sp]|uniref:Uncharacterized protein n=1 Tax=Phanerochaete carnosa (strain HHB-10118-sp) TaxID=650164 RepID=K5WMU7_PHACS|nr:uncharacterized protein PHACADRAFT_199151 [Phanerochaete carnosa HHB-10118-sp]EKM51647.1 hypothetical protein PHACADRAFT_199151 [Phanerochaete carnosa HHB-10118-sp]